MDVPETWVDERVVVKMYAEKEPLEGKLTEVNSRGIVIETDTAMYSSYPKTESLAVLAFIPMSKVSAILLSR
jgi:ribosomal protein S1